MAIAYRARIPLRVGTREYQPGEIVPGAVEFVTLQSLLNANHLEKVEIGSAPSPAVPGSVRAERSPAHAESPGRPSRVGRSPSRRRRNQAAPSS